MSFEKIKRSSGTSGREADLNEAQFRGDLSDYESCLSPQAEYVDWRKGVCPKMHGFLTPKFHRRTR